MNYISVLTVVSAFAVVALHTNGCFWQFSTERYWFTANIIESVFYFAVPVFFMISGATLLDYSKRYDLKTYFKKRIRKTVIPFLIWSLVGWGLLILNSIHLGQPVSPELFTISGIWNGIWETKFVSIYWFFIPLFACYLSIPLLATVPDEKRKSIFLYLIMASFMINTMLPFLIQVFQLPLKWPLRVNIVSGHLIYILLGYWLSKNELSRNVRYFLYLLAALGLLMHIVGTYSLSMEAGKIVGTYKGYLNVPCILYSVGVFLLFKEKCVCDRIITGISGGAVRFLRNYTFAIYILHKFIITYVVHPMHINTHSIVYRLLGPVVIGMLCIAITYVIRKIPFGKHILP